MLLGNLRNGIDDALPSESPGPDRDDDRRFLAGSDNDMLGLRRAVEEVPRLQFALFTLDDQDAGSSQDEECLLCVFPVISRQGLTGLEDVDVDAELPERPSIDSTNPPP